MKESNDEKEVRDAYILLARRAWRAWLDHLEECGPCTLEGGPAASCSEGGEFWRLLSNRITDLMRYSEGDGDVYN